MIVITWFLAFSALYPSIMESPLPHSSFRLITPCTNKSVFDFLSSKLTNGKVDFFYDLLKNHNTGFIFEIVLSFDMNERLLQTGFDLASFPHLKHITEDHVSPSQNAAAQRLKRNMQREGPKLVSSFEDSHPLTDFTENIFYLLQWKNMKIKEIKSIVSFKCYDYLRPYITHLQLARKNAPSAILGKCIKSLGKQNAQHVISCLISAHLTKTTTQHTHGPVNHKHTPI